MKCREPAQERRALLASSLIHKIFVSCVRRRLNCADMDTITTDACKLISVKQERGGLDPFAIIRQFLSGMQLQMPCSATAAEKTVCFYTKKDNQVCITFNWYLPCSPTQFSHFQLPYFETSCCWLSHHTGIMLILKMNDSHSKPLLKETLRNLGVGVV